MKIKLSICIPTFNRADLLKNALHSICAQEAFKLRPDIEIVISNNNSTDDTKKVLELYAKNYPGRIKFISHKTNISATENVESVLRLGSGEYRKLINDSVIWINGSLGFLISIIDHKIAEKPLLFFSNGQAYTKFELTSSSGINEFVNLASFQSTWIGCFGIWQEHLDLLSDFSRKADTLLTHTDALFRLIDKGCSYCIANKVLFQIQNTERKGGYSISKIFGKKYLGLLKEYSNNIHEKVFELEKYRLLTKHILPYYFSKEHDFIKSDIIHDLIDYKKNLYFYEILQKYKINEIINSEPDRTQLNPQKIWRKLNSHNLTSYGKISHINKIHIGKNSYGIINSVSWGVQGEFLKIGNFVSIALDVTFILGGNHNTTGLTNYPVKSLIRGDSTQEAITKGPIIVEDDVWIGTHCLINSGVHIGQGAVVAAGSVVTKDIPPYTYYGGNPAKFLKYRFESELVRNEMLKIDFSRLDPEFLNKNINYVYNAINENNVHEIVQTVIGSYLTDSD